MAGISSGEILSLNEVLKLDKSDIGKSVRTWGRVLSHDIRSSQVKIKDGTKELTVDTAFVEPFAFIRGSMYNFIGELICLAGIPVSLKARTATCIDGMDMNLFKQALDVRRRFLQEETSSAS
ncbi:hypothetical protein QZH41_013177 [Actinostola sp. cb2023]|nr:hypothetical protein QZH41_013177 [Actinostola sp. cb2023]